MLQQHPPGMSNETEGKNYRRRNAVSLAAQHKQNSPRPLLGSKPEAAGGEQETLSMPEFAPLRRCSGTGGDTAKSHFPVLLGDSHTAQKAKGSQSIHYTSNVTNWSPFCGAAAALTGEL